MKTHDLACRLLKVEQQLKAYEKLHTGELAELWQALNECKAAVADVISSQESVSVDDPGEPRRSLRSASIGHDHLDASGSGSGKGG